MPLKTAKNVQYAKYRPYENVLGCTEYNTDALHKIVSERRLPDHLKKMVSEWRQAPPPHTDPSLKSQGPLVIMLL